MRNIQDRNNPAPSRENDLGVPAASTWYQRAYSRWWDWRHRVATSGDIPPEKLKMRPELQRHSTNYMPTHPRHLRLLFNMLPLETGEYTLIDFGSGKGRVLTMAVSFPFREVIGIEGAHDLHVLAEANLRRFRGRRLCRSARSLCLDVRSFPIPPVKSVYYFFHPFAEPVMLSVLHNICRSLQETPRDCFLVYVNAELKVLVENTGMFELFASSTYSSIWRFARATPKS